MITPVLVSTQWDSYIENTTKWFFGPVRVTEALTLNLSDLYHPAITLMYKLEDLSPISRAGARTNVAASISTAQNTFEDLRTTSQKSSTIIPDAPSISSPDRGARLQTATKTGLGVGCVLFIMIVAIVFIFFKSRRAKHRKNDTSELHDRCTPAEMNGDARAELVASKLYPSHELKGNRPGGRGAGPEPMPSKMYHPIELEGAVREPEKQILNGIQGPQVKMRREQLERHAEGRADGFDAMSQGPSTRPLLLALIEVLSRLESWSGWNKRRPGFESKKRGYWRRIEDDI